MAYPLPLDRNFTPIGTPRERYAAALAMYRRAEAATYGTRITGGEFAAKCKGWMDLEVAVPADNEMGEIVTERDPAPEEWMEAAERVMGRFCDSYTVRNTLAPEADWRREEADKAAGLW